MATPNVNKRPKLQMSLLYTRLALDELGAPIFLGSFNQLEGPLPIRINFIVTNQYTNGLGSHRQRTIITDPEGRVVIESDESDFHLRDAFSSHRVDERFGVAFARPGRYMVQVLLDEQPAIEYYFIIRERLQRPAQDEASAPNA